MEHYEQLSTFLGPATLPTLCLLQGSATLRLLAFPGQQFIVFQGPATLCILSLLEFANSATSCLPGPTSHCIPGPSVILSFSDEHHYFCKLSSLHPSFFDLYVNLSYFYSFLTFLSTFLNPLTPSSTLSYFQLSFLFFKLLTTLLSFPYLRNLSPWLLPPLPFFPQWPSFLLFTPFPSQPPFPPLPSFFSLHILSSSANLPPLHTLSSLALLSFPSHPFHSPHPPSSSSSHTFLSCHSFLFLILSTTAILPPLRTLSYLAVLSFRFEHFPRQHIIHPSSQP